MSLLALLLCLLPATAWAQEPSTAGFISIDCGYEGKSNYIDKGNGIVYSPDEPYVSTGVNMKVSPNVNLTGEMVFYATVRSFPDGVRNCYTLGPVKPGSKYRVKAVFFYGNYDGLNQPPTFDIYLGVNFWATIETRETEISEIVIVADTLTIQVCLLETGRGIPFISELDLRPLPFSMYNMVNDSFSIVFDSPRTNFGGDDYIMFPQDIYDRPWRPSFGGVTVSTTKSVNLLGGGDRFPVPQAVIRTAAGNENISTSIFIPTFPSANQVFVCMYFSELQELSSNETREFSVYAGGELVFGPFRPRYLELDVFCTPPPGRPGGVAYLIEPTAKSTVRSMINAVERFTHIKMTSLPTSASDGKAILELKKQLKLSRNWEGDPCVPRNLIWEGLECAYDDSKYSAISSLNLSKSHLTGTIPFSIASLASLTSLDLSYNEFTGEIPDFLGHMSALKYLNLEENNLRGKVPKAIYEKSKNKILELRLGNNPDLQSTVESKRKKIVAVAASVSVLVLFTAIITTWMIKRKKMQTKKIHAQAIETGNMKLHCDSESQSIIQGRAVRNECQKYSQVDILNITKNFSQTIGRGSSGTVYLGSLSDGTHVAVKVLLKTLLGEKQFKTEAELLARVHHRNLVALLGYCVENMALVYEFASLGSLANQLSDFSCPSTNTQSAGDSANGNIINWRDRLQIALEAAIGLEYLHHGCEPPIIHRDVKTSNILITANNEAKIADFGLSKTINNDKIAYISTIVAGTPGYLDPEYQQRNRLSNKSDVYSFGVVLLELVTGKRPLSNNSEQTHIIDQVRALEHTGSIEDIADQRMLGHFDIDSLRQVVEIAMSCTSETSNRRPSMRDVVAQLKMCVNDESSNEVSDITRPDDHSC